MRLENLKRFKKAPKIAIQLKFFQNFKEKRLDTAVEIIHEVLEDA